MATRTVETRCGGIATRTAAPASASPRSRAPNPLREGLRLERMAEPCTMVICGATGDLTERKLGPALYNPCSAASCRRSSPSSASRGAS